MVVRVVEAIYKLKYFIFVEKAKNMGKRHGILSLWKRGNSIRVWLM